MTERAADHPEVRRADAPPPRRGNLNLTVLTRVAPRLAFAFGGVFLFILALQVIKSGAKGLVPILDGLNVEGAANSVGFGWLLAYGALSGSPVAAIGITLLAGGVMSESEAFGVVGGSRLGASFIVLAVGFFLFLRKQRNADGIYIGVVSLLTTITTQGPAILLGLLVIREGWLDGVQFDTPASLLDIIDQVYGPPVDRLRDVLQRDFLVFASGVALLLGSFSVFDRALPQLDGEAEGVTRVFSFLNRRPLMFVMGCLVTMTTMSVSISLTVLVPLSLKGYLKRDHVIPYVMGANITTFIDTLVGAVLLGGQSAFTVVLVEMVSVATISLIVLFGFYGPYSKVILGASSWATAKPKHMVIFLGAIVGTPLVLLFL